MEQPCYQCGQPVEQGTAFCLHCRAPQIRVQIAAPEVAVRSSESSVLADRAMRASESEPVLAAPWHWSQAVRPCAVAAVMTGLLTFFGLYPVVSLISAGFLAVVFYRQGNRGAALKASTGARLGALSGVFSFSLTAILVSLFSTNQEFRAKLREQFFDNVQKFVAAHPGNPDYQTALDQLKTPEGLMMALIVGSIFFLVMAVGLGSLGGAIGGAILRRRDPD